jgi:hypothetical protein
MPNPPFAKLHGTRKGRLNPASEHRLDGKGNTPTPTEQFTWWYENASQGPKTARKSLRLKRVQITPLLSNICNECVAVTY